jgi:hypothetical protein
MIHLAAASSGVLSTLTGRTSILVIININGLRKTVRAAPI